MEWSRQANVKSREAVHSDISPLGDFSVHDLPLVPEQLVIYTTVRQKHQAGKKNKSSQLHGVDPGAGELQGGDFDCSRCVTLSETRYEQGIIPLCQNKSLCLRKTAANAAFINSLSSRTYEETGFFPAVAQIIWP